jgi:hypothetical protein
MFENAYKKWKEFKESEKYNDLKYSFYRFSPFVVACGGLATLTLGVKGAEEYTTNIDVSQLSLLYQEKSKEFAEIVIGLSATLGGFGEAIRRCDYGNKNIYKGGWIR